MIKIHPQVGYDLLKNIPFPWSIAEIVLQHHEKLDGSGYPNGLKGNAILLEARILTVADVTEAESSHRPYRPTRGIDLALQEILNSRGTLYDTDAVNACQELFLKDNFQFKPHGTG
jgi:putative two-component system response regulator